MNTYIVSMPPREMRGAGWYEPPEWGCDVWEGEAANRREARWKAIQQWLREGLEPFGEKLTIDEFEPCPEHGAACGNCDYTLAEKRESPKTTYSRYAWKCHIVDEAEA